MPRLSERLPLPAIELVLFYLGTAPSSDSGDPGDDDDPASDDFFALERVKDVCRASAVARSWRSASSAPSIWRAMLRRWFDQEDLSAMDPRVAAAAERGRDGFKEVHAQWKSVPTGMARRAARAWRGVVEPLTEEIPKLRLEDGISAIDADYKWETVADHVKLADGERVHPSVVALYSLHDGQDESRLFDPANPKNRPPEEIIEMLVRSLFGGYSFYNECRLTMFLTLKRGFIERLDEVRWRLKTMSEPVPVPVPGSETPPKYLDEDFKKILIAYAPGITLPNRYVYADALSGEVSIGWQMEDLAGIALMGLRLEMDVLTWFEEFSRRVRLGIYRVCDSPCVLIPNQAPAARFPQLSLFPCEPYVDSAFLVEPECTVYTAVTNGVRVRVSSIFVPEKSEWGPGGSSGGEYQVNFVDGQPMSDLYEGFFTYRVRFDLLPDAPIASCQLKSRRWVIKNLSNFVEDEIVEGEGVVGEFPFLRCVVLNAGSQRPRIFPRTPRP